MGENAPDTLKKVANADQVDNSVEKNEHWTTWLKTVPQDAQYIGNLSIARILDIAKIASKNAVAVEIPEADKSGIFTWIHATNSRVDSAMFWSLKELTPLVKEGVKDFGSIMNIFSGDTQSAAPTTGAGIGSESDTTMPDGSPGSTQTGTSDSTTTTLQ